MADIKRMYTIDSSMIHKAGYAPEKQVMVLQFKNLATYQYENIDSDTYAEFLNANSIGVYFRQNIKDNDSYPCECIMAAPKKPKKKK